MIIRLVALEKSWPIRVVQRCMSMQQEAPKRTECVIERHEVGSMFAAQSQEGVRDI
jgi:hypothetical protein